MRFYRVLILLLALSVAGCGFQLRGTEDVPVPMESLSVAGIDRYSDLYLALAQAMRERDLRLIEPGEPSELVLEIDKASFSERVVGIGFTGKSREYAYLYVIDFSVVDREGNSLSGKQRLRVMRDFAYPEQDVVSLDAGRAIVARDMQRDAAGQLLRRVVAAASGTVLPSEDPGDEGDGSA